MTFIFRYVNKKDANSTNSWDGTKMGKVIGIDLGTTNSVAAYVEGKTPEIILTPEGDRLLPSLVAFGKSGERLVGNPAKSQLITNVNTIFNVKRFNNYVLSFRIFEVICNST